MKSGCISFIAVLLMAGTAMAQCGVRQSSVDVSSDVNLQSNFVQQQIAAAQLAALQGSRVEADAQASSVRSRFRSEEALPPIEVIEVQPVRQERFSEEESSSSFRRSETVEDDRLACRDNFGFSSLGLRERELFDRERLLADRERLSFDRLRESELLANRGGRFGSSGFNLGISASSFRDGGFSGGRARLLPPREIERVRSVRRFRG